MSTISLKLAYKYCCIISLVRNIWIKPGHLGQDFLQCHVTNQLSLVYAIARNLQNAASFFNFTWGLPITLLGPKPARS